MPPIVCDNVDISGNVDVAREVVVCTSNKKANILNQSEDRSLFCSCRGRDDGSRMIFCKFDI